MKKECANPTTLQAIGRSILDFRWKEYQSSVGRLLLMTSDRGRSGNLYRKFVVRPLVSLHILYSNAYKLLHKSSISVVVRSHKAAQPKKIR
ncbi:MAG TPA: hypothetical protein V6D28_04110 [Leptolyngbyaceae cyanobacterium]